MSSLRKLQLTLAIIKPDIVAQPHAAEDIRNIILRNKFLFVKSDRLHLTRERVGQFYAEHEGRFFYNRLVSYMTSGPITTHILARFDAIPLWRQIMGPTKVYKTIYQEPGSIRGRYGLTDTRNSTHGSDSVESAKREIEFFFPDFDMEKWYRTEEKIFREGNVVFSRVDCAHIPYYEYDK